MHQTSSIAFVALLAVVMFSSDAQAFSDVEGHPFQSAIEELHSRGIVSGYPDGKFLPDQPIKRAEFLKILMLSVYGSQVLNSPGVGCFADFIGTPQWFWPYACAGRQLRIIEGHPDGTFRGEEAINLAQALKMSFEGWRVPIPKFPGSEWYDGHMDEAAKRKVFHRFPFAPGYELTRGEMAELLLILGEEIAVVDPDAIPPVVPAPFPQAVAVCGNGLTEAPEQCDDGNLDNGDGCSKICVLVEEPVRHSALRVEQQVISSGLQVSQNRDVPLFSFTAIAGRQDVFLTTLKFKSTAGSLQNATNYRLFVDGDNDGTAETLYGSAVPSGEKLVFGTLNILVADGYYMRGEIRADMKTSSQDFIGMGFDTAQSDFVEGVDAVDGEEVSGIRLNEEECALQSICWIQVITDTDQTLTIATRGNLFVTGGTAPPRQIVASLRSAALFVLHFRADAEDIRVKELAIEGVAGSVESLELFLAGSSQPFAIGKKLHCAASVEGRFCTDADFVIPRNGKKQVIVKAVLTSDEQGAVSGESMTLSLSDATSGTVAVSAEGLSSGQQLLQNDGDSITDGEIFIGTDVAASNEALSSSTHTVTLAKFQDIFNASADADGSPIVPGDMTFGTFGFTAVDHGNIKNGLNSAVIDTLVFTVSAVNVAFESGTFRLRNIEDSSVTSDCAANGTTGIINVTCSGLASADIAAVTAPNQTVRLALRGYINDPQIHSGGSSALQTSLGNLGNPAQTGTVEWSDGESDFGWVDIGKTVVRSTRYRLD